MELAIFAIFSTLAVISAIVVVTHRNPVYSTMSLVVTLVSIAALFVMLGAPFIAALQVLLYTGAILVLFLFVIMLLNIRRERREGSSAFSAQLLVTLAAGGLFAGLLMTMLWRAHAAARPGALREDLVALRRLATELFTAYLLPFEIIGLLLLVAVVGATVLARREPDDQRAEGRQADGEGGAA